MGKHDIIGHALHTPKKDKFTQEKPAAFIKQHVTAPQAPKPGHSAHSMHK